MTCTLKAMRIRAQLFRIKLRDGPLAALVCSLIVCAGLTSFVGPVRAETRLPPRTDRGVYDVASVIDPQSEQLIERINHELYSRAGVAIVVLTVPRLEDETIDELAVRVGHTWGIGDEGRDRGLVIALAVEERRIFVATGYGTEEYLPDGRVGALIDEQAIPYLRANRFSEALLRLDAALAQISAEHYGVRLELSGMPRTEGPARPEPGPLQFVFGVLALIALAYLAIRHPRLFFLLMLSMGRGGDRRGGSGFGGGGGFGGHGGGFGGGGAGRGF